MSLTRATPADAARAAKAASHYLATLAEEGRNAALSSIHDELVAAKDQILAANASDMEAARKAAAEGHLSSSLVSRLDLSKPGKFDDMLRGILDVKNLPDPIGRVDLRTKLDDGLILERVSCPIGVLLVIFEARPEVIANIASLAVKSGNAAILKGGSESEKSFVAISNAISRALERTQPRVPKEAIQLVLTRDAVACLLDQDQHIDLVIPRGSNKLVRHIKNSTRIPVLGHADGLCCIYVEDSADPEMACAVLVDAKLSYPAACNSVETLLVQESALPTLWPRLARTLLGKKVELRCDAATKAALPRPTSFLRMLPSNLSRTLRTPTSQPNSSRPSSPSRPSPTPAPQSTTSTHTRPTTRTQSSRLTRPSPSASCLRLTAQASTGTRARAWRTA